MPLLHIRPSQVDIQLSRALSHVSQDLLEDGGGATGLYPEGSGGVAEEVGGDFEHLARRSEKSRTSKEIRLSPLDRYEKPMI